MVIRSDGDDCRKSKVGCGCTRRRFTFGQTESEVLVGHAMEMLSGQLAQHGSCPGWTSMLETYSQESSAHE